MSNDFKYVMHDMTNIYIGAKYTYPELVDLDDIPFRFRMNISQFVMDEVDENMTLGEHILNLKKEDRAYRIYRQIKARVKLTIRRDSVKKGQSPYVQKEYKVQELVEGPLAEKLQQEKDSIFVEELHITTLGLLAL